MLPIRTKCFLYIRFSQILLLQWLHGMINVCINLRINFYLPVESVTITGKSSLMPHILIRNKISLIIQISRG